MATARSLTASWPCTTARVVSGCELGVELAAQRESLVEAGRVHVAEAVEVADGLARREDREGRVPGAEEARVRARPADRDVAGQGTAAALGADDGAEGRVRHAAARRVAGVHEVDGALMVALGADQRAEDGELAGVASDGGEQLAEAQAGDRCGDGLEAGG